MQKILRQIFYSFPVQLLLLHLRSNLLLLSLWVFLVLLISGVIGRRYGFQYLFLDPEYLGEVSFLSFYLVGMALGGFFMSWNLTTYLLSTQYFPFLASLARPFSKFSFNNLLLPLAFGVFYLYLIGYFQYTYQQLPPGKIAWYLLAVVLGTWTLIIGYAFYLTYTNKDISYYRQVRLRPPNQQDLPILPGSRTVDLDYIKLDRNRLRVDTYLTESCRPRLVRSVAHYESRMLLNIFRQNHLNALALQLITMVLLLLLGLLSDWQVFRIPASASVMILLSVIVAIIGALTYWFAEWRAFVIILLLVGINYLTSFGVFNHPNFAYGLDYSGERAPYTYAHLQQACFADSVRADRRATLAILNRRKERLTRRKYDKPKLVIISASGGGLKAATWATHVVQTANRLSQGQLLDRTILMTGASGGMLGLAYLREVEARTKAGDTSVVFGQAVIDAISKDLLNTVAFTMVSNDVFIPWSRFAYGDHYYFKDRAYAWEQQFNENTGGLLDKPLAAYRTPEARGEIPLLYLTPAIINDGRQMVISAQPSSFMMIAPVGLEKPQSFEVDAVDFRWLLRAQAADNLRFLTGLRMNATFPYVLPMVHLPTSPQITLADAGYRDNYGILAATRFIQVYKGWIQENTDGIILVQLSSRAKIQDIPASDAQGIVESLLNPLGIARQTFAVQEYQHDSQLSFVYDLLGSEKFEVVRFNYRPTNKSKLEASVSFHLTRQEKADVLAALKLEDNQASMERLLRLLRE
ncbi:MAG: patatin-like phospholipase family protein [Bacteroidetes bacterium]|nr:MAG: patatin-like phospholipase family protein [Bacteroidota bacterium]